MQLTKEQQDKVVSTVTTLQTAMQEFITAAPTFEGDTEKVKAIGIALAHLETTLHWDCGVWELGLPR